MTTQREKDKQYAMDLPQQIAKQGWGDTVNAFADGAEYARKELFAQLLDTGTWHEWELRDLAKEYGL